MTREDLRAIAPVIREHNLYVLSDEIYGALTYVNEGKHTSIAEIPGMKERTVLVNGFSKAYAMTGWRLGYACGPRAIIRQMTKIHQYAIMCAPTTSQYAAVEAIKNGDEVRGVCDKTSHGEEGRHRSRDGVRRLRRRIPPHLLRVLH